jgi:catecholate siderophore receptor
MVSPRFGVVLKPMQTLSLYASHSVSFLPSAGDQFASLTDVTKGLEPERFINDEVGAKWDVADRLALTAAVYRLDRKNTRAPHPTDPALTVQTGRQRSSGWEMSASGSVTDAWDIVASYANQRATIMERTSAAAPGARVPLVPRTTASLWSRYQFGSRLGLGIGVTQRDDMFTGIDNTVTLPGYTEVDGAIFLRLGRHLRAQANVANVFDVDHYDTAHSNNNITPGTPRSFRVSLTTGF